MQHSFVISPEQCRAARALLGWTQAELARRAATFRANVVSFERGQATSAVSRRRIQEALESAGVTLIRADAAGGIGAVLKPVEAKQRQPYLFDARFYEAQARLIAAVARQPAYVEMREGLLLLSRDYHLQARHLADAGIRRDSR